MKSRNAGPLLAVALALPGAGAASDWTRIGQLGSGVTNILVDPANGSHVLAFGYSETAGAFRSTDFGSTWSDWPGRERGNLIAIVPGEPPVFLSSTFGCTYASSHWVCSGGLVASSDGGTSWKGVGPEPFQPWAVAYAPSSPAIIYAAGDTGEYGSSSFLIRSNDRGATWERASAGLGYRPELAVDPADPATLLTAGSRSSDSGATWNPIAAPERFVSVAWDASRPGSVWAVGSAHAYRSTDSGITWAPRPLPSGATDPDSIVVDGRLRGAIYITSFPHAANLRAEPALFESHDDGASWRRIARARVARVDPTCAGCVYRAGPGVARSTDRGETWADCSRVGATGWLWRMVASPIEPGILWTGAPGWNGFRSTDGGRSWDLTRVGWDVKDGWSCPTGSDTAVTWDEWSPIFAPSDSRTMAAIVSRGLVDRSTDAGMTWKRILVLPQNCQEILSAAFDPRDASILYVVTDRGEIRRSTDGGVTWQISQIGYGTWNVVPDPSVPRTLLAGTWDGVSRSTDSGTTWTRLATASGTSQGIRIEVESRPPYTFYGRPMASMNAPAPAAGIYRSTDAGATWAHLTAGLPDGAVRDLALDPSRSGTLYVLAEQGGVFRSTDSGSSWARFGISSPGTHGEATPGSHELAVDASGQRVYASSDHTVDGLAYWTDDGVWAMDAPPSHAKQVVPVVLDLDNGSARYATEIAVSSPAATRREVTLTYVPSMGTRSGGGYASIEIPPGQQVVYRDALAGLRDLGLPIPASAPGSPQGGTLTITASDPVDLAAIARTTSPTRPPLAAGDVGVAYAAVGEPFPPLTRGVVCGLRANESDRSNLGLFNPADLPVTLRVTLVAGAGDGRRALAADGLTLPPGGWAQLDSPLVAAGMTSAWAIVERTSTGGSVGAYGVINDNVTNDGSYVPLETEEPLATGWTVPVVVETPAYASELLLANTGGLASGIRLRYRESLSPEKGGGGSVDLTLAPGEQRIVPDAMEFLRERGIAIGARGEASYAGVLRIEVVSGGPADIHAGARVLAPSEAGGRFGVFAPAVRAGGEAAGSATVYGLAADVTRRSNVAVLNAGTDTDGPVTLRLDVRDGSEGGAVRKSLTVTLAPGAWAQPPDLVASSGVANGYVTVTRTAGTAPWIAYGVVNDGGAPGRGTGDGSYVPMTLP